MTRPTNEREVLFEADDRVFEQLFDREPFAFQHRLADSRLFEPERLVELAQDMAQDPRDVYYDAGDVDIGHRWADIPVTDLSIRELLERIRTSNAWIVLRRLEKFPEYAVLLEDCMAEIQQRSGLDLNKVMKLRNAILFINSPNRISSYHIDRECSCLFQIRGQKTINIFDRADREVLPEDEIERFWAVDNNAPIYRPHLQHRAQVFELVPGSAVHIPLNAPHWVQNGPEVSISLNINFHYKDHILADVYRANYWLRRIGMKPKPPRTSATLDYAKRAFYLSANSLRVSKERVRKLVRSANL